MKIGDRFYVVYNAQLGEFMTVYRCNSPRIFKTEQTAASNASKLGEGWASVEVVISPVSAEGK